MLGDYNLIEIQEFLVTINLSKKKNNANSSMQIIQFTHAIRSQEFKNIDADIPNDNDRLVPNIDDDGNI